MTLSPHGFNRINSINSFKRRENIVAQICVDHLLLLRFVVAFIEIRIIAEFLTN